MIRRLLILVFIAVTCVCSSQSPLSVTLDKEDVKCYKGSASLGISGGQAPVKFAWSTGDSTHTSIANLEAGDYTVHVHDESPKDTIIAFTIADAGCEVGISNHFTPNDDGFNDTWSISNVGHYPNFELIVFNRSGQTVHHQQAQYTPWDGRSFGIKLPDATYYYIFYFDKDNKGRLLKGDVSILR